MVHTPSFFFNFTMMAPSRVCESPALGVNTWANSPFTVAVVPSVLIAESLYWSFIEIERAAGKDFSMARFVFAEGLGQIFQRASASR